MKIALAMIIKNTEPDYMVARCLYSVAKYVDGLYLTITHETDEPDETAETLGRKLAVLCASRNYPDPVISYFKWVKDFSAARNFNFSQVPKDFDYIIWLDTDDVLVGGEHLRKVAEEAKEKNFGAVFFNYKYRVELDPETQKIRNVLIEHLRERLVRNDGSYKWIAPIHETLIEQRETNKTDSGLCEVVHITDEERMDKAIHRNIEILEKQLAEQGNRKDPRTLYYLGKSYFDLRTPESWQKAEELIMNYLNGSDTNTPSGWAEERGQAWEYLSEIYRESGLPNKAIKAGVNAMIEDPKFPQFYISMGLNYMFMGDWQKAKHWALLAQKLPYPKTTLVLNPRDMQARTLEILFQCAVNTNDVDGAWAAAYELRKLFPNDKIFDDRVKALEETREKNAIAHKVIDLAHYLNDRGQLQQLHALVMAIPREIAEEPIMVSLRRDFSEPRKWNDDEITILCGKGFEKWSPKNLETGIGGSEEAVIYLSRELRKLGWKVTVYADPQDDAGTYVGVVYKPYFEFNPRDEFNILIGWRNVGMFDQNWKAKKTFLWLHDIQNPAEYTKERIDRITKIFALSKWHRDNMPNVADEKFMITGNGINLAHFKELDKKKIKRNPYRCIYTSSYDRGLEHLLTIWPDVIKEVPKAELHIFYGWNLFESFYRNNPERMMWKAKIDKLMEQKGVHHHGRVGQKQVLEETYKSAIWAYPTHFGEISCITAMKCQAAGAIPVVCDYAALKETAKFGKKVNVDVDDIYEPETKKAYTKALIEALTDHKWQEETRTSMMRWARERFTWETIASEWSKEFMRDELKEASDIILEVNPELERYMPVQLQQKYGYKQTY